MRNVIVSFHLYQWLTGSRRRIPGGTCRMKLVYSQLSNLPLSPGVTVEIFNPSSQLNSYFFCFVLETFFSIVSQSDNSICAVQSRKLESQETYFQNVTGNENSCASFSIVLLCLMFNVQVTQLLTGLGQLVVTQPMEAKVMGSIQHLCATCLSCVWLFLLSISKYI